MQELYLILIINMAILPILVSLSEVLLSLHIFSFSASCVAHGVAAAAGLVAKDTTEASGSYEKVAKENSDLLTSKLMWTWCGWLIVLPNRMPHSAAVIYTRYR